MPVVGDGHRLHGAWAADADGWSDLLSPFTFTGRRLDEETKDMQYRNRNYSPSLGRFGCRDPRDYKNGCTLYTYVSNMPFRHVDPLGLAQEIPAMELGAPAPMRKDDELERGAEYGNMLCLSPYCGIPVRCGTFVCYNMCRGEYAHNINTETGFYHIVLDHFIICLALIDCKTFPEAQHVPQKPPHNPNIATMAVR